MSGSKMVKLEQRERLLEEHRYINVKYNEWWDCVYADFREDMKAVGIDVVRMFFSGFWSQGDGACFEGSLVNAQAYLDKHHVGQYPMIRRLVEHDGGVYVNCSHRGNYYHQNCTEFWVDSDTMRAVVECPTEFHETIVDQWNDQLSDEVGDFEKNVVEQWRLYMQDLYFKLEAEYDYLVSDEAVWETIEANELDQTEEAA